MITRKPWRLFHRSLVLFVSLGVIPILIIAVAFALPHPPNFAQFKILIGLLLITSTVSTLCLAGLVVKILKHPLHQLLHAQDEIKRGHLGCRLTPEGSQEMQSLFQGFNDMAVSVALAAEQEKQIAADKSLAKVASQVVHDLRSPLSTLQVVAYHFESKTHKDPDDEEFLNILRLSIDRVKNIAEELLSKRKTTANQPPTLLHSVVEGLITEFRARNHSQLQFVTDYHHPAIPLPATTTEIQRAFGNIMTNAIEAMLGIGTIRIKTSDASNGVCIQIEDNGPGMTEDVLQKVLKGGFTYGKQNGNGVGMTVVRDVVEKYNGTLRATSTPGIGTTFFIELPLYSPA